MKEWADFYERLFNFREVRYFDIEGKLTGLKSKAMTSPCGKIRIPINESSDDKSQIAEYLDLYHGEGIQHIALGTDDIYATVDGMRTPAASRSRTRSRPTTTWSTSGCRTTARTVDELKRLRILIDGATHQGAPNELLLQIFTQTVIGPIFFEIIQRKGDQGFGEGNFRALFESIELDQIRRGVLKTRRGSVRSGDEHSNDFARRRQQGRGARHLRPGRAPAARRLRDGARRLHLRPGLGRLHRRPSTTCTAGSTSGRPRSCRAWPATSSSRRCSTSARRTQIPRFDALSRKAAIARRGWEVVAVPGLIPEEAFFALLAARKLPGHRLAAQARGVRLHRRARRVP